MTEEIKEILNQLEIVARKHTIEVLETGNIETMPASVVDELRLNNYSAKILLNYITNLQKENEDLKDNQVRALNKIKDYINASKCETLEGNYSNDEHSQYWILFNKQLKEIQKLIKGVNINQYVNIPKYREKELLNKEEKLGDYKQRNEKAFELLQLLHYKFADGDSIHHDIEDIQKELQGGDE